MLDVALACEYDEAAAGTAADEPAKPPALAVFRGGEAPLRAEELPDGRACADEDRVDLWGAATERGRPVFASDTWAWAEAREPDPTV